MAAKYDTQHTLSFAYDSDEYWESVEWMVWMQSGLGPMQGQANHFHRYAPERIKYATNRYQNETTRLYQVLEDRLAQQQARGLGNWLVGAKYSIADICCVSWVNWAKWAGIDTANMPNLIKWVDAIDARDATPRALNLTDKFDKKEKFGDEEKMQRDSKAASDWIVKSNAKDFEE